MNFFIGALLPLIGTVLGAFMVFFVSKDINNKYKEIILSLSSGIMISSAIWSLLIPAIEQCTNILIPVISFLLGILFLLLINNYLDSNLIYKNKLMILSIILHNIPEGMAVGVAYASVKQGLMTPLLALILSLGIAIQNIPEGAIISIPLFSSNHKKNYSFLIGCLSGIVEPIGALLAFIITSKIIIILPWILSFASGTMIYVVIQELLPECKNKNNILFFSIGFLFMIILEYIF